MAGILHVEAKNPATPDSRLLGRHPGMPDASSPREKQMLDELQARKWATMRAQRQRKLVREEAMATKERTNELRKSAMLTELKRAVLDEEADMVEC